MGDQLFFVKTCLGIGIPAVRPRSVQHLVFARAHGPVIACSAARPDIALKVRTFCPPLQRTRALVHVVGGLSGGGRQLLRLA